MSGAATALAGRAEGNELRHQRGYRVTPAISTVMCVVIARYSRIPPNALTLSCKSRPPCRPHESGAAAAATNAQRLERPAADVTRECSSEPPEAAPPPSQGSAVFVSL